MAYRDFTMAKVGAALGITTRLGDLCGPGPPEPVPTWLAETLRRSRSGAALLSEKARSEFLVVPILMAALDYSPGNLSIYSGQTLDVDPDRGLTGECDFILARTPPIPLLLAPLVTIVEAEKGDVESGLGQCVAQMVAAKLFNDRAGEPPAPFHGCVTSGEVWQFLRLDATEIVIDRTKRFIDDVGAILSAWRRIIDPPPSAGSAPITTR